MVVIGWTSPTFYHTTLQMVYKYTSTEKSHCDLSQFLFVRDIFCMFYRTFTYIAYGSTTGFSETPENTNAKEREEGRHQQIGYRGRRRKKRGGRSPHLVPSLTSSSDRRAPSRRCDSTGRCDQDVLVRRYRPEKCCSMPFFRCLESCEILKTGFI